MRWAASRKMPAAPRQPGRPRNLSRYRSAAQKPISIAGTGIIAQGKVKSGGGAPSPDTRTAIAAPHPPSAEHGEFQASQAGGPRLGVVLVRARHLQGLLVQGTPAMRQQPAEARGHHRVHLPPGQPQPPSTRKIPW